MKKILSLAGAALLLASPMFADEAATTATTPAATAPAPKAKAKHVKHAKHAKKPKKTQGAATGMSETAK